MVEATDRQSLQKFECYVHGKGLQLVRGENTYSIVPRPLQKKGWEINDYQKENGISVYSNLHSAIQEICSREDIDPEVTDVVDFYDNLGGDE